MECRGHHGDSGGEAWREGPALGRRSAVDAILSSRWLWERGVHGETVQFQSGSVAGKTGDRWEEHDPADTVVRSTHCVPGACEAFSQAFYSFNEIFGEQRQCPAPVARLIVLVCLLALTDLPTSGRLWG